MVLIYPAINYGAGPKLYSFRVGFADLQATSGAGAKTIPLTDASGNTIMFPQGSKFLGVNVKPVVAFAGPAISAMTASVGKAGGTATFFTAAYDVFAAVSDTNLQETALFKSGQTSAFSANITFTPTGAANSVCTAGDVAVDIYVLTPSTPSLQ